MELTLVHYRTLIESLPLAVYVLTGDRLTYMSPQIEAMLGYPAERWLANRDFMVEVLHEEDRDRVVAELARADAAGDDVLIDYRVRTKDGRVVWLRDRARPVRGDEVVRQGFLVDVTALRESEERYRDLFENANDMIFTLDLDWNFTSVNRAFAEALGYTEQELLGRNGRTILTGESIERAERALAAKLEGKTDRTIYEDEFQAKDGTTITAEISSRVVRREGKPVGIQAICRDVGERRRLEEQLRQSQRMETVGRLAGGLAHDFNNLLTAITGYGELMDRRLSPDDPARRDLLEIQKAAARASSLTGQLLAFGRKQILQPRTLSPNDVVAGMEKMLRRLLGEDIVLELRLGPDAGLVRFDPGQLEQVLVNLVVNARDATPGGGKVTIETFGTPLADGTMRVGLSVADTGVGMDEQVRSRAFEPFFTTKGPGEGSGLGLSTVIGLVEQSGGFVELESEPGRGTRVTVSLPEAARPARTAEPPAEHRHEGSARILLLEDEEVVRALVREILEHAGFDVVEARTPAEALDLCESAVPPIDVLLTDVVMPGMSGPQIASALTRKNPELRVLYMSGYTDEAVVRHGVSDGHTAFLQKPFTSAELTDKVRAVLDEPVSHAQP
jgi:PAS domain S-box-containing protein